MGHGEDVVYENGINVYIVGNHGDLCSPIMNPSRHVL